MKNLKTAIFLFVSFFLILSCSDNRKRYYPDGTLDVEAEYGDGKKNGIYKDYYPNGNLKTEAQYADGKLNGLKKVYLENGKPEWEAFYLNEKENGIYKEYYPSGKLKNQDFFKEGKQDGIMIQYYENGNIETIQTRKNGVSEGIFLFYYPSGKFKQYAIVEKDTTVFYHEFSEQEERVIKDYHEIDIKSLVGDTIHKGDAYKAKVFVKGPLSCSGLIFQCLFIDLKIPPKMQYLNAKPQNEILFEQENMPKGTYTLQAEIIKDHIVISSETKTVVVL